jgi:hypothetical protein
MSVFTRVGGNVLLPRQDVSSESVGVGKSNPYLVAKVIDFFPDPRSLSDEQKAVIKTAVDAGALVDRMPINSIWCQILGSGRLDNHIAYPFFPPHLCLPLKPTEEVWIISDGHVYYWVCRRVGDYQSEDTNYTFVARVVNRDVGGNPSAKDAFNGVTQNVNNFPQGSTNSIYTATIGSSNTDDKIIQRSVSYQQDFAPEAVPRLVRKPGDFVIQGSNNSSITLGTAASATNQANRGIVDIVAGHALKNPAVVNTRNNQEVDKTKAATSDGPTDLINDKSRLYLGVNENVDSDFAISISGIGGSGPAPSAVVKSDQVRIVARSDVKITSENTKASVVIRTNGDIVVVPGDGAKVYLAGTESDQAYLRYDEFNSIINNILDIATTLQLSIPTVTVTPASEIAIKTKMLSIQQNLQTIKSQKIVGS